MTIPFLEDYYEFREHEEYGDIIAVLKTLTFFNFQDVTINEIYSSYEIPNLVKILEAEIQEISAEYKNEQAWLTTWFEYVEKGINQCGTKEALASIILPQSTNCYFSTIIEKLQSEIPVLASRFQIEFYNNVLVIFKYKVNEAWQEASNSNYPTRNITHI